MAQQLKADAALVVTPYYNRPTQEGLYQHFKAVAEATRLPIILYNIHARTAQNLSVETIIRLANIPNITGIKETSHFQMMEIIEKVARKNTAFSVLSSDDNLTLPCMALGGDGIISVVSNLFPKDIKELVRKAADGDLKEARDIHYRLFPLFQAVFVETSPSPIKAAMNMCRFAVGGCRLPLCSLTQESARLLQDVLKSDEYRDSIREHLALFESISRPVLSIKS